MDAESILSAVLSEMNRGELDRCQSILKEYGEKTGLIVAENEDDLKTLALEKTDLVEQE